MKRSFAVALVVVLTAGLTAFLWWRKTDARPHPRQRMAARENSELMALRNEVSSLQGQIHRVAAHQAQARDESTSSADDAMAPGHPPAAMPAEPPVVPLTPEEEAEGFKTYFGELDLRRNAEPRDAVWQTQVERKILDVLTGELAGSKMQEVDCGKTLCRLEVQHRDLPAQHLFMQYFHPQLGTFLPQASLYSPPGSLTTDVYLAREGHSLPSP